MPSSVNSRRRRCRQHATTRCDVWIAAHCCVGGVPIMIVMWTAEACGCRPGNDGSRSAIGSRTASQWPPSIQMDFSTHERAGFKLQRFRASLLAFGELVLDDVSAILARSDQPAWASNSALLLCGALSPADSPDTVWSSASSPESARSLQVREHRISPPLSRNHSPQKYVPVAAGDRVRAQPARAI